MRLILLDFILGASFLVIALNSAAFYILIYQPAFGIPAKIEEFKCKLKELACISGNNVELAMTLKRVNSVQCIGVKVGKMTIMHRLSLVIFIDAVVQNVLALLITY
ncbi:unnamed protein product [Allacma fusca]|uniref:Uncharacterized protein n=1 Tax=Allacma fusca TaxID=39272 RepID=A0A8J2KQW2_9HEXA|nr:unnamed protein product [Allacma fusca]